MRSATRRVFLRTEKGYPGDCHGVGSRAPEKCVFREPREPARALFSRRDCKSAPGVIYGKRGYFPAAPTEGKATVPLRFTIARHSFVIRRYLKESDGFVERVGKSDIGRRSDDLSL